VSSYLKLRLRRRFAAKCPRAKFCVSGSLAVVAGSAVAALAPATALASAEHPRLFSGLAEKSAGIEVPTVGWGTIQVTSHLLPLLSAQLPSTVRAQTKRNPAAKLTVKRFAPTVRSSAGRLRVI
jgi:hypothetical protein